MDSNHRRCKPADLQSAPFGHSGILPFFRFFQASASLDFTSSVGHYLQITPFLLIRPPRIHLEINFKNIFEPMEGVEPTTPRLQITCSSQLSYIGNILFSRKGIAKIGIISYSPKLFAIFPYFLCRFPYSDDKTVRIPSEVRSHSALCSFWLAWEMNLSGMPSGRIFTSYPLSATNSATAP